MTRTCLTACLVAAAFLAGCSTTTNRIAPSEHALEQRGVEPGDVVLLRYRSAAGANSSNRSREVEVSAIGTEGLVGTDERGDLVVAKYDELFQVEHRSMRYSGVPGAEKGGDILKGITKTALVAACIVVGAQC